MPINDANDFEGFNRVLTSLCDVGCLISSADIKATIETWRAVVKLSEKFNNCCSNFPVIKIENSSNTEMHWYEKAILGIFKELKQILQLYNRNITSSSDTLLQIAQFYLKILRLLINYSKIQIKTFPASKEFLEIYSFCLHEMWENKNPKIDLFIRKGLYEIFSQINNENSIVECLLQHFKYDVNNFESCELMLDYLKVKMEHCVNNRTNITADDVNVLLKFYNCLFEGPLIFVDKDKYGKILEKFVVLTALDSSYKLHKKLCEYVVDSAWIRAYTSMEILNMYYSYIFKHRKTDIVFKSLEFWIKMWNKLNKTDESLRQYKKLIEILLKTILYHTNTDKLQQNISNKYENIEIILLLSGKETEHYRQYLQTALVENLNKLQKRHINVTCYTELLNLLEICKLKPQLINHNLQQCILNTFISLFSLADKELQKFREFINKTLRIFYLKHDKQLNDRLLLFLMEHEQQCFTIQSVFLMEFLLQQKPISIKLLQTLQTSNIQQTTNVRDLLENTTINIDLIDLKVFQDLNKTLQSSRPEMDLQQIRKKPRLDKGNFSNIKFILNDLDANTQKLLQIERSTFDANDIALIQVIRNNLDKCLNK
ncbi:uncharacterized protein LOC111675970 [Lucilia cuprina]|uniref:uncharacterized protein LOC111675970 n=1 Tax=Lucilia cuprina TaxID=7375 RepID=UPI001F05B17B|nr:uncharacterized protein LOC111675970 [Lucilia cuprina]